MEHNCGIPLLLLLSWERGHSQAYYSGVEISKGYSKQCYHRLIWKKIKANVHGNIKPGGEKKKNLHVLMPPYWTRLHISPLLWNQWSMLSPLGKAVEMEWTRFISAPSEKCKVISGMVLSGMVISGRLDLQTLTTEGHVRQWPISDSYSHA